MFKGSLIPTFTAMMVIFYVKTLGKSGVNLQFYTLRTHDGTMWSSLVFPSRIVVLGLHDIVT